MFREWLLRAQQEHCQSVQCFWANQEKRGESGFSWQIIRKRPVSWCKSLAVKALAYLLGWHLVQCVEYRTICRASAIRNCHRCWGWSSKQSSPFSRFELLLAIHMDMYKDTNKQAAKCQQVMCHTEKQDRLIPRNKIRRFPKRNWLSA